MSSKKVTPKDSSNCNNNNIAVTEEPVVKQVSSRFLCIVVKDVGAK